MTRGCFHGILYAIKTLAIRGSAFPDSTMTLQAEFEMIGHMAGPYTVRRAPADVGPSGLVLRCGDKMKPGSRVMVRVRFPGDPEAFVAVAVVKASRKGRTVADWRLLPSDRLQLEEGLARILPEEGAA